MTRCTHLGFHPNVTHQNGMFACAHILKLLENSGDLICHQAAPESPTKPAFAQIDGLPALGSCIESNTLSAAHNSSPRHSRRRYEPCVWRPSRPPEGPVQVAWEFVASCRLSQTHNMRAAQSPPSTPAVQASLGCAKVPGQPGGKQSQRRGYFKPYFLGRGANVEQNVCAPLGCYIFLTYGVPDSLASFLE